MNQHKKHGFGLEITAC